MFGAHIPELILILVGALIVFGPKRLPEIGGALGKGIRDFRKGVSHLDEQASDQMHSEVQPEQLPSVVPERKSS